MRISVRLNKKIEKVRNFFYLYTSGLNHKEIERLLKKDTLDAFAYFKSKTGIADQAAKRLSISSTFFVCKEIFISFIMQLTPARRLFYGIGIVGFLLGLIYVDLLYIISQINSRLHGFVKSDDFQDDATMVAFKVK